MRNKIDRHKRLEYPLEKHECVNIVHIVLAVSYTHLAKQLNISPQQMKYVTHTEAGEGLIFYGNVVLPFVDRFPKATELYRVMTTKPEDVGEA